MSSEYVFILFLVILLPYIDAANRLSDYVNHYEPVDYDAQEVHKMHLSIRKSPPSEENVLHVDFKAHNRDFRLRLKKDLKVFGDLMEVHDGRGKIAVDTAHIYHGLLEDEPQSHVFGSIFDGVFEGNIVTPKGQYFVERTKNYFSPSTHPNRMFHSVIYHEDHINDPYEHLHQGHSAGCGINDDILQWMENIQNSVEKDESVAPVISDKDLKIFPSSGKNLKEQPKRPPKSFMHKEGIVSKYSKEANANSHSRHKRETGRKFNKNTCSLSIQTDPLIWRHIKEQFPEYGDPSKELDVIQKTREEILALIANHVAAINYIYRDTKFDGRTEHRNIQFEVQKIKIDDDASCRCTDQRCGEMNQFCKENINVTNFLNIHSLENHEDFCLAYVFTYRDFIGGTLGLTWVPSASGAPGGICEKYKTYTKTIGGMSQSMKMSLNTGIITLVNYGSRVPPKVSQLNLAHQIGHNFGSPHDYPPECKPGGPNGNFIMFASATSGDRPNNSKFSACSIGNISNILDAIEDHKKRNCFTSSDGAFCGNKIVEAGEECDCGYDDNDCQEKCCYPRIVTTYDKIRNSSAKGCQRRSLTECSPSQGPCCSSETCKIVPFNQNEICKAKSDCSMPSRCNGRSAECPQSEPLPDKTKCNNNTQLCTKGECSGSICFEWNLQPCFLTSQDDPNIDKRKLCELACQNGTDICRSTSEFADKVGLPVGGISLTPGSACDDFQGYCNDLLKCSEVYAGGPSN